jgi:hypothetical protein
MSFCCTNDRAARGSSLRALFAATGVAAMLAVGSAGTAHAASISPTVHSGNVNSCSDIETGAHGYELGGQAGSGIFGGGTYAITADQTTFAWASSTVPVSFVVVKGGPDANVYVYGGSMGDSGLVSPLNPGGQVPAISHVLLCYGEQTSPPPVDNPPVDNPPVDNPPVDNPPVDNPPVDNPPVDHPPVDNPPVENPPAESPPAQNPPADSPIGNPPVSLAPAPTAATPAASAAAAAPAQAVKGTRVARGTASLRLPGCATRRVRVTVNGSPMRRIVFSVNGRRVATVTVPAGRRSATVTLPVGAVSARVTFRNGAPARTLRATARHCARTVRPRFTG